MQLTALFAELRCFLMSTPLHSRPPFSCTSYLNTRNVKGHAKTRLGVLGSMRMLKWFFLLSFLLGAAPFSVADAVAQISLPQTPGKRYDSEWAQWGATGGSYWVSNNIWNAGSLAMNKDYAQSVNIDRENFPNETSLTWNYPYPADGRIFGFPEIVFGQKPGKTAAYMPEGLGLIVPPIKKVNRFTELSVDYDINISGIFFAKYNFAKYNNVAFDLWLTSDVNYTTAGRKFEIFITLHSRVPCRGEYSHRLDVPTFAADVWLIRREWTEICVDSGRDIFSGEIVISDILNDLIKHGVITGEEYIGGVELGAEPGGGIGALTIKKFNVIWK